ncbi:MAG: DUF1232 domain-containing protein [Actinomycetota bacterium]|nr:DUF1232 domain-containing protein [Actinomycetota bacterium]
MGRAAEGGALRTLPGVKDPRVPRNPRILAACVVSYAFNPIDLIPDPIPVM